MGKYSKGDKVSYKGSNSYTGKSHSGTSNGVSRAKDYGSGTVTSVQRNTVRVSNSDGTSTNIHKNRIN